MSNQRRQVKPVRRTWWVKLRRAEKHLSDIRDELARFRETQRPYDVVTSIETHHEVDYLVVRGYVPRNDRVLEKEFEDFAALIGDFAVNMRASLDHICVALGRNDRNYFPIFKFDPWAPKIDPVSGEDLNKEWRDTFKKSTVRVPKPALALIKSVQPYESKAVNVEFDPLALLAHINNADKHRRLLVTATYLCNTRYSIEYPGYEPVVAGVRHWWEWQGADGAIICDLVPTIPDLEPHVEASGGFEIGLQEVNRRRSPNADWVMPGVLDGILIRVRDAILTPLDVMI